jgi:hypothetical protein
MAVISDFEQGLFGITKIIENASTLILNSTLHPSNSFIAIKRYITNPLRLR